MKSRIARLAKFLVSLFRGAALDGMLLAFLITAAVALTMPDFLTEARFSCWVAPAVPGDYEITVGYATPLSRNYFQENTRTLKMSFPAGASGKPDFQQIELSFPATVITNVRLSFAETTSFQIRDLRLAGFRGFRLSDNPSLELDCSPDCLVKRSAPDLVYIQPQRFSSEIMSVKAHDDPLLVITGISGLAKFFAGLLAALALLGALLRRFRMRIMLWCWSALLVLISYALNLIIAFLPDIARVYRTEFTLGALNTLYQHGPCFLILTGCLMLSSWKRFWQARALGFLLFLLFFGITLADFFIMRELNARLVLSEAAAFGWDLSLGAPLIKDFALSRSAVAALILLLCFVRFVNASWCDRNRPEYPPVYAGSITLGIISLFFLAENSPGSTVDDYDFASVIAVNSSAHQVPYSSGGPCAGALPEERRVSGLNTRKNLILIDLESFSSYQSKFFGGFFDSMPELDRLARNNVSFTNYYSNGFASDPSNFAMLTGQPYINGWRSLTDPVFFDRALPKVLHDHGYHTTVMYSARNVFHADELLRKAGFAEFSDGQDPHYVISERLTFNAVPDRDLFDNLFQRVSRWKPGMPPFFTMALTATTHAPFLMPLTHTGSYQGTLKYTDKELRDLIARLESIRYFDHGMVVIVADHRVMLSLTLDEQMEYGERALGRVPLLIIGSSLGRKVFRNSVGHDSLSAIISYLLLDSYTEMPWQCNPLARPDCQEDVFYQKKGPQDEVLVFRGDGDISRITLDGDNTRVSSGKSAGEEDLLRKVCWFRK
ncbi:LTA synthase family protein [Succinimonas sp.]|uniref:LTA synthase family protein n=1 Tax=Succinimonas sp. TaxID=1936151 RepID=UPI0038641ADB